MCKQVWKILKILPKTWESKVDAITEAKDLMTLPMDELIVNLKTYELKIGSKEQLGRSQRKKRTLLWNLHKAR